MQNAPVCFSSRRIFADGLMAYLSLKGLKKRLYAWLCCWPEPYFAAKFSEATRLRYVYKAGTDLLKEKQVCLKQVPSLDIQLYRDRRATPTSRKCSERDAQPFSISSSLRHYLAPCRSPGADWWTMSNHYKPDCDWLRQQQWGGAKCDLGTYTWPAVFPHCRLTILTEESQLELLMSTPWSTPTLLDPSLEPHAPPTE